MYGNFKQSTRNVIIPPCGNKELFLVLFDNNSIFFAAETILELQRKLNKKNWPHRSKTSGIMKSLTNFAIPVEWDKN